MEVLKCGSIVITKIAGIRGMITCVSIRFDKITYEITYFSDSEQRTIWMDVNEFEIEEIEKIKIGFKKTL